jgi:hypothetical protein
MRIELMVTLGIGIPPCRNALNIPIDRLSLILVLLLSDAFFD